MMVGIAGGSGVLAQSTYATRPPLGLDVSLPAAKRMAGAREYVDAGDWDSAIRSLEQLEDEFGDSLIEVEPRRYVNVRLAVASALARLPPEGLATYRRRVDPTLEAMFEEAAARRDPALMRQTLLEGFASSVGGQALDWLAETSLVEGEFDRARQSWIAMLPPPVSAQPLPPAVLRFPDASRSQAEICARLVLCSVLQGDLPRARREWASFVANFDQAEGSLAGRSGPLAQTLESLIDQAAGWSANSWNPRGETSAGNDAVTLRPDGILWSVPLGDDSADGGAVPDCRPSVWNDVVLIDSPLGLRALSAATGRARWPVDAADAGFLDTPDHSTTETAQSTVGTARYDGQVVGERWYGRRGSPISVAAVRTAMIPPSELVCFDLNAEGRLVWSVVSDEVDGLSDARFSGPPIITDDRLVVAVRRAGPQIETGLACFGTADGALLWSTTLCAALESGPPLRHRIHQDVLAAGAGQVFQCPGAGVIAATDLETGTLRWAVTYDASAGSPGDEFSGLAPGAMLYHGGRLFVKPADASVLIVLNASDGRLQWSSRWPGRIGEFLGVESGRLIAAGDHLWGIDVATGESWQVGFDDPEGFGFGSGTLAPGRVYWTTRNELFVVEPSSGRVRDYVPLDESIGLTGGNLAIAGATLVIVSPTRIAALGRPTAE